MSEFRVWECQICNWIYDEQKGCPEEGLAPGTKWEDVPGDWSCPECGVGKDDFDMVELSSDATEQVETTHSPANRLESSQDAPLVIIGTGLAGYNLAKQVRKSNSTLSIVMVTADDGAYYSKPQLSNAFSANKRPVDLVLKSAEEMANQLNAQIYIHTRVTGVDTHNKSVTTENGMQLGYSKLVFATGATCVQPKLNGNAAKHIHQVNDLADYAKFRTLLRPKQHVLVIGAGLIGSEYADDLSRSGYRVSVVDPMDGPLASVLPKEASSALADKLSENGVLFHFGTAINALTYADSRILAKLTNGTEIEVDIVLSAIGIVPNTTLAQEASLACRKGIKVDKYLRASQQDVFAIGDCAEVESEIRPYISALNAQVNALANTLVGESTEVNYGVLPVFVKTKLHPVIFSKPIGEAGHWEVEDHSATGVKARFLNHNGELIGYALTGEHCNANDTMQQQCSADG